MGDPALEPATYANVLAAPEGTTAEILGGELHLSPRPSSAHRVAELEIGSDLRDHFGRRRGGDRPGGWWFLIEPELHLGKDEPTSVVAVPDLAGWRRDRMPTIPSVAAFTLRPDWVCEILSPGPAATRRDRVAKPDAYATAGIPYHWIVDPLARTVEVYELRGAVYAKVQAFAGEVTIRALPFDAVELDTTDWWLPEPP
jgi:Uma2 family endonuclease